MESTISFYELAQKCRHRLLECLGVEDLQYDNWARKRLNEFDHWAGNYNVFKIGNDSLDAYLASNPDRNELVRVALDALTEGVEDCINIANGGVPRNAASQSQSSRRLAPMGSPINNMEEWDDYARQFETELVGGAHLPPIVQAMNYVVIMMNGLTQMPI